MPVTALTCCCPAAMAGAAEYGPQKEYSWVEVCVYRPDVTDVKAATQRCYATSHALSDTSFTVTARPAGTWSIGVRSYPACAVSGVTASGCAGASVAYRLTAKVQH